MLLDRNDNLKAAVGPACTSIIDAIERMSPKRRATRAFTQDELTQGHWMKVGDHGYGFIVTFHPDGSATEFDPQRPSESWKGRWSLDRGELLLEFDSDTHYALRVIASRDEPVHSGVEVNGSGGRNDFRLVHGTWQALAPF